MDSLPLPEVDYAHLLECCDRHCGYCNDEEPRRDPEVQAWLDALLAQSEQIAA